MTVIRNRVMQHDDEVAPPKPKWEPTGRRKELPPKAKARRLDMPKAAAERYELIDLWFYLAPQIAGRGVSSTLLGLRKWINRDNGTAWVGDEKLARWSGMISKSKVGKDIALLIHVGLLTAEHGFTADRLGKLRKSRTIRLALPDPMPKHAVTPTDWEGEVAHVVSKEVAHVVRHESAAEDAGSAKQVAHVVSKEVAHVVRLSLEESLEEDSPDRNQDTATNGYARAKAIDAEPGDYPGSAASEVADHSSNDEHDRTARPQRRASVEPPSPSVEHESEI